VAPFEQVSAAEAVLMVGVDATTHWWLSTEPLPVHAGLAHVGLPLTVSGTHWPLVHWLLFVHKQLESVASGVPGAHVAPLALHDVTQPSVPPFPAVPVQLLPVQPGVSLAHLSLLHWLSALHTHLPVAAL
jgi:hypothetical protein